jgi:hypothetical protein
MSTRHMRTYQGNAKLSNGDNQRNGTAHLDLWQDDLHVNTFGSSGRLEGHTRWSGRFTTNAPLPGDWKGEVLRIEVEGTSAECSLTDMSGGLHGTGDPPF